MAAIALNRISSHDNFQSRKEKVEKIYCVEEEKFCPEASILCCPELGHLFTFRFKGWGRGIEKLSGIVEVFW